VAVKTTLNFETSLETECDAFQKPFWVGILDNFQYGSYQKSMYCTTCAIQTSVLLVIDLLSNKRRKEG